MHLHISHGVPTAMQSIPNVWGDAARSARNGTVGRKGLKFLVGVIWEVFFTICPFRVK